MFKQMLKALFGLLEQNEVEVVMTRDEIKWLRQELYKMDTSSMDTVDKQHQTLIAIKLTHSLR